MFGPPYTMGCATCSTIADGFDGFAVHPANHDVMLWAVSLAPLAKLKAFKKRMGWTFPWASSLGDDFNFDFNVSITKAQQREGGGEYNYRRGGHAMVETTLPEPVLQNAAVTGVEPATYVRERPGMSAFALEDDVVYPSPLTGQGTSLALVGAYVLAEEIDRSDGDMAAAAGRYERRMRPFVAANLAIDVSTGEGIDVAKNAIDIDQATEL
jgi:predicted dithiol-disulfide oxidoreductase (DUF899 family)